MKFICKLSGILLLLYLCALPAQAQPQAMIEPHAQAMPLLPFLDYYIDPTLSMDIEEVARLNPDWPPFSPDKLPLEEGIVWLRFKIAPLAPDARPRAFLLDMGESAPGQPILYDPIRNELSGAMEWRENVPSQRNILLLPEAGPEAIICYIRVDGLPGPWFAPMIRTPQNAASNFSSLSRTGAMLALAVTMLLCFLRGMGESGQWRHWTALFVGVALAQAVLGMPRESQHLSIANLACVLCPGLALMFLPHVGRHLMQARLYSRAIDIQLFLLSLPGAALAVLPLAPGFNWLDRWVDLWPLGTLIFVPTALGAWMMALPGARRFLLACLLPPLFVGLSLAGMEFGVPANLLASGPLWGIALSALLLVATRMPQPASQENAQQKSAIKEKVKTAKKKAGMEMPSLRLEAEESIINLDHPLDDPNLRLIPANAEEDAAPEATSMPPLRTGPEIAARVPVRAGDARELALREPIDDILREAAALRQCALPPSAREAANAMATAAQRLAGIVSGHEDKQAGTRRPQVEKFNLQRILRGAHDSVAAIAECSGIALSWYMPPHLEQSYRGDASGLENVLRLLLESAVRCSRHGAIKISARTVPGSTEPGNLLFTVSDDGRGYPPEARSSLALARAWELAGEYGGFLSVEASEEGATIAFSARFKPLEGEDAESAPEESVILASTDPGDRRQLARIIETIPCRVIEAGSPAETLACQHQSPSALLITQGRMARPASGDMVREFCRMARQAGLGACHVLALTGDDSQWPLLKTSGFTHAMLEPVDPEILRRTVAGLLNLDADTSTAPFQPDSSALEKSGNKDDVAPTMLIEQDFAIMAAFEEPDWLGEKSGESTDNVADKAAQSQATTRNNSPENAVEWVGEPMPIAKPQAKTGAPQAAATQPAQAQSGADAPLADFVAGASEAQGQDAVSSFLQGSANLVGETLAGMLNKNDGELPETGAKGTDAEVAALLERLDEQMRRANLCFQSGNARGIAEAAEIMGRDADAFGLRLLTRMAQCVERAARAPDMDALKDLLPELAHAVERNNILIAPNADKQK